VLLVNKYILRLAEDRQQLSAEDIHTARLIINAKARQS